MACQGNIDRATVASFGAEWARYDQAALPEAEARKHFDAYFSIFPWERLPPDAEGFDMGCGSGRWARHVAPRVGCLHCVDPAAPALAVARKALKGQANVTLHEASAATAPLAPASQDFGYSLGVLHHVPDTERALGDCVRLLKPGAPFLVYLYYRFDNRPAWFRALWRLSEGLRRVISRLPEGAKAPVTDTLALAVYWPLARLALLAERAGLDARPMPLHHYRRSSLYVMRTDSRDRFGTPLEQRFTRNEIAGMMGRAGLTDIRFSEHEPYWCAVGIRNPEPG